MKQLKIIHLADIHFAPDKKAEALASLETAYETGKKELVDLFIVAGDLFDRAIYNTENSGLPELQRMIQKMMDIAPVVAVRGTPTHDAAGCYEVFQETNAEHSFTLLDPHHAYFLINGEVFSDQEEIEPGTGELDLLILGLPEVSKEWFLADKRLGRDESVEAIKEGMRNILLGLAAQRKEHSDSPCVLVYHGMVSGSTLQNNQILKPGGIEIGRDDLALVGFDYGALGHIHLEQQIPGLNAYYAGPAYHTDWGHLGRCGFNLIRFDEYTEIGFEPVVERHDFPHPPRKKISVEAASPADGPGFEYDTDLNECVLDGFQVWLDIEADRKTARRIDRDGELVRLVDEYGALPGSRVTVSIQPTETVRAGEIQTAKSLAEKVIIYSENSGQKLPGKVLEKTMQLESEARRQGGGADGLHIRIDKLSLRGAIGTWKGLGKDEIALDLAEYDPGLVALLGPNGAGKTTLIENMHPFTELLTRSGKLQDHFRLRDSHRDLYFTDERTGDSYRAFIQVDGQNKTGKAEYHLYRNGQPMTNGRKEDYENRIRELFGSLNLFVRSAFIAQKNTKNTPDLSDATKGERKALFRELGGLDYLQQHSETSKENAKALEGQTAESRGRATAIQELIIKLPELESQKRHDEGNLAMGREALKMLEKSNRDLKSALEQVKLQVDKNRETQGKITDLEQQFHGLRRDAHGLKGEIEDYQMALEEKDDTEKALQEYESLKAEEGKLNEEKAGILEERELLLATYGDIKDAAEAEHRKIDAKKAEISQKMADFQQKKAVFLKEIDHLQQRLEEKVECPNCGHQFSLGQEADENQLKENQSQVWEIDQKLIALEKQIVVFDKELAEFEIPAEPVLPEWDDERLDEVQFGLSKYNLAGLQRTLAQANEAGIRIEENEKQLEKNAQQQESLTKQLSELNKQIDPECEAQYDDAAAELEAAERQYIDGREEVRGMEVALEKLKEAIEDLKIKKKELADLQQTIKDKEAEITEWRYLERACGPDGIQALELDAMSPAVESITNDLLSTVQDSEVDNHFDQIKIDTLRIGGQGSKRKQIEDFIILCHDTRDGDWTELSNISVGETVWVRRALYDAFAIIRNRNVGCQFLTAFQDESDSALDPEKHIAYFRLLERTHEISGRRHTIVISHSEAAQEMIAQKIEMANLEASPVIPAEQVTGAAR